MKLLVPACTGLDKRRITRDTHKLAEYFYCCKKKKKLGAEPTKKQRLLGCC